jgi:hypothetical protein
MTRWPKIIGVCLLQFFIEVRSSLCMQSHIVILLVIATPAGERWVG